jgi:predicted enzyme related to lactoylglutathione lyase
MANPVIHFEIAGRDAGKLQSFYSGLFDWKIDANNPMSYGVVEAAEGGIGGGIGPAEPGGNGHLTFYVGVDDPDEYLKKVESLGGRIVMPTTTIPGMVTFALFQDLEGNMVGLVKNEMPHDH